MFSRPIKEINAEYDAEEKNLESIIRLTKESCLATSLSKKAISSVTLAIEEGVTNIIRHAYLYEKGKINLKIVIYKKLIVFSLIDTGRSFTPDENSSVNLEKLVETGRKGGLGFYLIKKIMDSVEYISTSGINELRMTKRLLVIKSGNRPLIRRLLSLRVMFSVWTFAVVSTIVAVSFYFMDFTTTNQLKSHLDDRVEALGTTVADQAAGYIINQRSDVEFDQLIVSYLRSNQEIRLIVLTDGSGIIVAHSDEITNIRNKYRIPESIDPKIISEPQPIVIDNENLNYIMIPIKTGALEIGKVHLIYSADILISKLTEARNQIILLTVVLLLFGVLGIYLLSNHFVRPIARITEKVRRFTSGELETELPLEGAEEFFEISRAFNQMLTRLNRDKENIIKREKLAKEIELAAEIQKTLLPTRLPEIKNLEIDAHYQAASIVGGDLYDVFEVSENSYCLVVADVSGKGVPASLVMSMLKTVIRIFSVNESSSKKILNKVNNYLAENIPPGIFVTVMMVIYDDSKDNVNFSSAGHNPLIHYQASTERLLLINPKGMPLGISDTLDKSFEETLEERKIVLKEGDLMFIFTDGLNEARDKNGNQYGLENLAKFVGHVASIHENDELSLLCDRIKDEIDSFSGFDNQHDDITFIVARKKSNSSSEKKKQASPVETKQIKTKIKSKSKK